MDMTRQEKCCQFLKEEGFPIADIDERGEVVFRCEGQYYILHLHPDHERFALALPAFWSLEDSGEATRALYAANKVNLRFYGATVVCLSDTVTAFTEMFVTNPAVDLKAVFSPALKSLQAAVHTFVALMLQGEPPDTRSNGSAAPTDNGTPVGGYL